jgi:hypothetical protein
MINFDIFNSPRKLRKRPVGFERMQTLTGNAKAATLLNYEKSQKTVLMRNGNLMSCLLYNL